MKDYFHSTVKWISHNRYTFFGLGIAATILSLSACTFTAKDPKTGKEATKQELITSIEAEAKTSASKYKKLEAEFLDALAQMEAEDARLIAQYEAAIANIDRQEQTWTQVLSWVNSIPAVGSNPVLGGALGLAGMVFGLGVGVDNRRKDRVIKRSKSKTNEPTKTEVLIPQ